MTEVSAQAYVRIALHAAKYPYATALGLLVGPSSSSITDVLPLLHHWTSLSPMAEAGLALAEQHCKTRKPAVRLQGVYVVNAGLDDRSAGTVPTALARAIAARAGSNEPPLVLVLDNRALATGTPACIDGPRHAFTLADASSPALSLSHMRDGRHRHLGDFDDHLEDISVRWLEHDVLTGDGGPTS